MAQGSANPRVDVYIAAASPFAQPILMHLRALVHAVLPGAEETHAALYPRWMQRGGHSMRARGF